MLTYALICTVAFVISLITLYSGFGLGTVLMPVFAIFFPLPVAIASTAIVHLANNLFKALLIGKWANWRVVVWFGVPAAAAAALGAYLLGYVYNFDPIASYFIQGRKFQITTIGLTIGVILILSSLLELIPRLAKLSFSSRLIPLGGALSGFFGGLSGNQGILRSAFLIKMGLSPQAFIGTGVICSLIVDSIRLIVYGWAFYLDQWGYATSQVTRTMIIAASLAAFLGAYIGSQFVTKITPRVLQLIVGIMVLILGCAIALGII